MYVYHLNYKSLSFIRNLESDTIIVEKVILRPLAGDCSAEFLRGMAARSLYVLLIRLSCKADMKNKNAVPSNATQQFSYLVFDWWKP